MLLQTAPGATGAGAGGASTSVDVLLWVGALIVAVLILGILILLMRKRLFVQAGEDAGGMLDQLRALHRAGNLSTEEYDAARKALTTRVAAKMGKPVAADAGEQERPAPTPRSAQQQAAGELRARPGFDLTGAPLPSPRDDQPPAAGGKYDRQPPRA